MHEEIQCSIDIFGCFLQLPPQADHLDSGEAKTTVHLSQEIDATADYEGRDSCADDGEERDGTDVLEEVTLNVQGHTAEGKFIGIVGVLCNTRTLFICKVGHSTGTQEHIGLFYFFFEMSAHCLNWSQ